MTGTTPIYGIRYPDQTTKVVNLAAELAQMGGDVERALQAAAIPPVTPAPVMVATTATARDAYWGVPGTETARRTLQDRGATTIRTDRGWTERYFAAWNAASNPGGASPAGWYPTEGAMPFGRMCKTDMFQSPGVAGSLITGMVLRQSAGGVTLANNRLQIPVSGLWRVTVHPYLSNGTGRLIVGLATGTSTTPDWSLLSTLIWKPDQDISTSFSGDVFLTAGTPVGLAASIPNGTPNIWGDADNRGWGTYVEVCYLGPRQG